MLIKRWTLIGYPAVSGFEKMRNRNLSWSVPYFRNRTGTNHIGSGSETGSSGADLILKAGTRFPCSPLLMSFMRFSICFYPWITWFGFSFGCEFGLSFGLFIRFINCISDYGPDCVSVWFPGCILVLLQIVFQIWTNCHCFLSGHVYAQIPIQTWVYATTKLSL